MIYGLGTIFHNLNVMDSVGVPLSYQDIKKLKVALGHKSETTRIITRYSNHNPDNGVNSDASMHQLVKFTTNQKNRQLSKRSHNNSTGTILMLRVNTQKVLTMCKPRADKVVF